MKSIFSIFFILSLSTLFLTSCTTTQLSRQQCLNTNWYQQGVKDGADGYQRNVQKEFDQCAHFRIKVNPNEYDNGWRKGLNYFCTYEKAYSLGAKGRANPHICLGSARHLFNAGYQKGIATFCQYPKNAFDLAAKGDNYPSACSMHRYPDFYKAYQQGANVYNRTSALESRINAITTRINRLTRKYDFNQNEDGTYALGDRRDSKAVYRLNEINHLTKQKENLEDQLLNVE